MTHRTLLLLALALPTPTTGQLAAGSPALPLAPEPPAPALLHPPVLTAPRTILIHLAQNRLYLLEGRRILWSAPVATGTGFRLDTAGRTWHFSTPRGLFRVQRKEKDPIWIRPDWAFLEEGRPVPPLDSPLRREHGMLGTTALYIGRELAIHGTSRPDLVLHPDPDERRVSHGCIRLTNEDARRLYHLVDIGTPVLIY